MNAFERLNLIAEIEAVARGIDDCRLMIDAALPALRRACLACGSAADLGERGGEPVRGIADLGDLTERTDLELARMAEALGVGN